jgi:hypothetical protein
VWALSYIGKATYNYVHKLHALLGQLFPPSIVMRVGFRTVARAARQPPSIGFSRGVPQIVALQYLGYSRNGK